MNTDHPLIAKIVRAERALRSNPRSAVEQYDAIIADARFGELDAPVRSLCHLNRGIQRRKLRQFRQALADYEHAATLAPHSFKPHLNSALVLAQDLREFQAARAAFDRGIALNPGCVDALYSRALVKIELNDYDGAEADLNSALALAPEDPNALSNLGTLQMKQGRLEQAADSFQTALRFAPRDHEIRCNAALALERLGMHDAAQDILRRDGRAIRMWEEKGGPRVPPRIGLVLYLVIAVAAIGMAVFVAWRLHNPR
jgi:tetratricopeptide (TPR) repeat protein